MTESAPLEDIETGLKSSQFRYAKMKTIKHTKQTKSIL